MLEILTPEEIQTVVLKESKREGFDDEQGYIRVRAEDFVKAGIQAVLSKLASLDEGKLKGEVKKILSLNLPEDVFVGGNRIIADQIHALYMGRNQIDDKELVEKIAIYLFEHESGLRYHISFEELSKERNGKADNYKEKAKEIVKDILSPYIQGKVQEYEDLFDLRDKADRRAIKLFRDTHPEYKKELRIPDHADLVCFLMGLIDKYDSKLKLEVIEHLDESLALAQARAEAVKEIMEKIKALENPFQDSGFSGMIHQSHGLEYFRQQLLAQLEVKE